MIVQLKGDSTAEESYVSKQHVLLCSSMIVIAHQIHGWAKQTRKRSKLWKRSDQGNTMEDDNLETKTTMVNDGLRFSNKGKQIRTSIRFLHSC